MARRRVTDRRRWFGFEVLEVRRLLTGQPGTISGATLENPVVGVSLTASGLIDTVTHHPTHATPDLVDFYQVHLAVGQQLSANVSLPTGSHLHSYLRVFNSVPSEVKNGGFAPAPPRSRIRPSPAEAITSAFPIRARRMTGRTLPTVPTPIRSGPTP